MELTRDKAAGGGASFDPGGADRAHLRAPARADAKVPLRPRADAKLPLRMCIGCGDKAAQRELVRLHVVEGQVAVDRERSGGRGAWLHPARKCLERATKRRAFGRAFRASGVQADARVLWELLTGNARKD